MSSRFHTHTHPDPTPDIGRASPAVTAPAPPPGLEPNQPRPADGGGPVIVAWHEFQAGDEPPARHHRYRRVTGRYEQKLVAPAKRQSGE